MTINSELLSIPRKLGYHSMEKFVEQMHSVLSALPTRHQVLTVYARINELSNTAHPFLAPLLTLDQTSQVALLALIAFLSFCLFSAAFRFGRVLVAISLFIAQFLLVLVLVLIVVQNKNGIFTAIKDFATKIEL